METLSSYLRQLYIKYWYVHLGAMIAGFLLAIMLEQPKQDIYSSRYTFREYSLEPEIYEGHVKKVLPTIKTHHPEVQDIVVSWEKYGRTLDRYGYYNAYFTFISTGELDSAMGLDILHEFVVDSQTTNTHLRTRVRSLEKLMVDLNEQNFLGEPVVKARDSIYQLMEEFMDGSTPVRTFTQFIRPKTIVKTSKTRISWPIFGLFMSTLAIGFFLMYRSHKEERTIQ